MRSPLARAAANRRAATGAWRNIRSATVDHRAKLKRARQHLKTLDGEIQAFMQSDPYELRAKSDAKRGGYIAWLSRVDDVPSHWSLIVAISSTICEARSIHSCSHWPARTSGGRRTTEKSSTCNSSSLTTSRTGRARYIPTHGRRCSGFSHAFEMTSRNGIAFPFCATSLTSTSTAIS